MLGRATGRGGGGRGARRGAALLALCSLCLLAGATQQPDDTADYGQLPCERQRFRQAGASKIYTSSQSWLEVSYATLYANAQAALKHVQPGAIPLAVVKGHAFGHSLTLAARAFVDAGFQELGVADLNEAITLRQFGITQPIHLLFQPDFLSAREMAYEEALNVYVEEPSFVEALCREAAKAKRSQPIQLHILVATWRMGRGLGTVAEIVELAKAIQACPGGGLALRGLATHHGDFRAFQRVVAKVRAAGVALPLVHMATSSHLVASPEAHLGMVRLGRVLYAMGPPLPGIEPAARWLTRIVRVSKVREGDLLRGEGTRAHQDMTVAHIYNSIMDGFLVAEVLVRGRLCQRVDIGATMGPALIDVSAVPGAAAGDLVVLHGKDAGSGRVLDQPRNLAQVSMLVPRVPLWP